MAKYLYGAAVQGIQPFIFATNELKDIVGASELVAQICDDLFAPFRGNATQNDGIHYANGMSIVKAAGNIKFLFDNKEACRKAVLRFPKIVLRSAPGVTVSQAVVEVDNDDKVGEAIDQIEAKLRACRNRPMQSTVCGLMGVERSRQSGLPVECHQIKVNDGVQKGEFDAAKRSKQSCVPPANKSLSSNNFGANIRCTNISTFTKTGNNWIAIIHIDGNGLGQIVQKVGKKYELFSQFSLNLNEACQAAARAAANFVISTYNLKREDDKLPIRPIVLSGDDHTLICRADLAVPYVEAFLREFEKQTETKMAKELKEAGLERLTACAGIAFIKTSYPFYYGYDLAESLCDRAKKDAKNPAFVKDGGGVAPSCLAFHKVQDSFVENFADIAARELSPCDGVSFEAGPYYLSADFAQKHGRLTIAQLLTDVDWLDGLGPGSPSLKEANAIKSTLRQWLAALHKDKGMAAQMLNRLKEIHKAEVPFITRMTDVDMARKTVAAYNALSLHSVVYGD